MLDKWTINNIRWYLCPSSNLSHLLSHDPKEYTDCKLKKALKYSLKDQIGGMVGNISVSACL